MGILAERLEDEHSASFDIECPQGHRETPDVAHGAWTAGVMSEMCGHLPVSLGVIAFMGTVTTRFQASVPMGERLIGRATLDGRERRKLFVTATLCSAESGVEFARTSAIMITAAPQ